MDSTRELRARTQLNRLGFKYPDIDGYIAEFEDLITQANYNLASQEAINLFLKGFSKNRSLLNKVFTLPVPVTYDAMKRRLIAIVKSMQLVNLIAQNAPDFRTFRSNPQRPPPLSRPGCHDCHGRIACARPDSGNGYLFTSGLPTLPFCYDAISSYVLT